MTRSVQCMNASGGVFADAEFNHVILYDPTTYDITGFWKCNNLNQVDVASHYGFFNPADLDPLLIAGAVGGGLFALLPLWAVIWGGRKLIEAIR